MSHTAIIRKIGWHLPPPQSSNIASGTVYYYIYWIIVAVVSLLLWAEVSEAKDKRFLAILSAIKCHNMFGKLYFYPSEPLQMTKSL